MPVLPVVLPALFAAAIAFTVFSVQRARIQARARAMEAMASRLGIPFSPDDIFGLLQQLKDFDLFRRERRWLSRTGRIRNIMRSQVSNTDVFMFDYTYVVSTGKSSRRVTQTVFFAQNKDWYLPNFRLKPETWWRKVLAAFGTTDINFPESPEFSDKFWLTGELESLIRRTFSPEVQQFLMERPPVHLEGNNYYLLAYKPGKALRPDEAETFFEHCCQLVRTFQQEKQPELLKLAEIKPLEVLQEKRN